MNSSDLTRDLAGRKISESSEKSEKSEKTEKAKIQNSTPRNSDEEKEGKNLKDLNTTQDLIDQADRMDLDDEPHVPLERSRVMLSHKQDVRNFSSQTKTDGNRNRTRQREGQRSPNIFRHFKPSKMKSKKTSQMTGLLYRQPRRQNLFNSTQLNEL